MITELLAAFEAAGGAAWLEREQVRVRYPATNRHKAEAVLARLRDHRVQVATELRIRAVLQPTVIQAPKPGQVGEMPVSALRIAPERFQYKLGTDADGTGTLLKEQQRFNCELAGTISVWRDPENNQFYVINGHHRLELAKRTGVSKVAVRHIVANDGTEARAIGALQNISEGRGTPVDAAKFLRDTGLTPDELKVKGISMGEATAAKGLALSQLDMPIFNKVVSGDLPIGRAVAIGGATKDAAEQRAIFALIQKKEKPGRRVNDDTLRELTKFVKSSGKTEEFTASLFGEEHVTKSLALEKAEISAYIRQQLAKDRKLFDFVPKQGHAKELERGGNVINVEKSKELSISAAHATEVYDKLSSRVGPIGSSRKSNPTKVAYCASGLAQGVFGVRPTIR
jgi:hypothetical protein